MAILAETDPCMTRNLNDFRMVALGFAGKAVTLEF
jgi:hypothetical protein